jgi:hypothetical protein
MLRRNVLRTTVHLAAIDAAHLEPTGAAAGFLLRSRRPADGPRSRRAGTGGRLATAITHPQHDGAAERRSAPLMRGTLPALPVGERPHSRSAPPPLLFQQVSGAVTTEVGVACKSVGSAYEGSNPSPATPGVTAPDQRKRGSGAALVCPVESGSHRLSPTVRGPSVGQAHGRGCARSARRADDPHSGRRRDVANVLPGQRRFSDRSERLSLALSLSFPQVRVGAVT